ncbi:MULTISPECIES: phosphoribosyl-AMP cyclohydrolase [Methylorubrum]|uniref:phosphoribosyl-AMP cyclohydrolase n=1 Tax=Methylorubrum TaxID=2282523 RepID=UPI0020A057ED|nr:MULTISPECIES: phosphoribosyl-AMP cyclohydrolase [Methylorubrum]MCP1548140.1 phosphoribosyl-AMP cyclohydrolase [Methylorubrum zatmanii]MCP1555245.1 phosphoribosyl-AMP cyclohydrolase [Methylorubrum extorquens]MCP1578443.1 phosphoribosyl-AMP cyclohydrolase [Methylorubrum extorquens]
MTDRFASPGTRAEIEEGAGLTPRFGPDGLVACIAVDAGDGRVLMLAHMNAEALARTLETGEAWYWSRSRSELWHKGATSGQIQRVVEMRVDCDQDAILIRVDVAGDGGCCHTGRRSCFYRAVERDPATGTPTLVPADPDR